MTTTIESYLRVGALFVPVADCRRRVEDELYIWGAIDLTIAGQPIITRVEFDLVDQLWSYLLNLCESVAKNKQAGTMFPDQPIELWLTPHGRRVEIVLRSPKVERRAFEDRSVFFAEVARAGTSFFEHMIRVTSPSYGAPYQGEIARLAHVCGRAET